MVYKGEINMTNKSWYMRNHAFENALASIKNNYMFMGKDETGEYDLFKHNITREYIRIPNDNYFINNAKGVKQNARQTF